MISEIRQNLGFIAVAGVALFSLHWLFKKYAGKGLGG